MMNELEVFTAAASSDTFVYLSLICALAYAAWTVWLIGQGADATGAASIDHSPRIVTQAG